MSISDRSVNQKCLAETFGYAYWTHAALTLRTEKFSQV